jgi:hypothetical protein
LYDSEGNLHYVKYNDVSFIVDRVYSETGVCENITDVILVFLGIDETGDKEAVWAVDVTPHGPSKKEYNQLIQGKYRVFFFSNIVLYIHH